MAAIRHTRQVFSPVDISFIEINSIYVHNHLFHAILFHHSVGCPHNLCSLLIVLDGFVSGHIYGFQHNKLIF
jgi:hypothetical protein